MENNPSLDHYEVMYKAALVGHEIAHRTPRTLKKVEDLQHCCRICGCHDDGNFVELDAVQEFEFDTSVPNYRVLFQRGSLQFQFHTMPDLPSRICTICAYKAKIFYLLTRQFVVNQHGMRSSISDWYQRKYGVEAPEQYEDKMQMMKQLLMVKAALNKKRETPRKYQIQQSVKDLMKQCPHLCKNELKRSVSADDRLDAGCAKHKGANTPGKIFKGGPMAQSTANLRYPAKSNNPLKTNKVRQQSRTARSEIPKVGYGEKLNREKTQILKTSEHRECLVPPRVSKADRVQQKPHSTRKIMDTSATGEVATKTEIPQSKAQLQQRLQERRRQWR